MTKKEVQQRVTQFGKKLALNKFSWNVKANIFSSEEDNLVIDFAGIDGITFHIGSYCTCNTGSYCTFNTLSDCTFKAGSDCTFKTGHDCTFKTGSGCTFKTGHACTFNTGAACTFNTESYCTFKTRSDCTFKTWSDCTFNTESYCTFKTRSDCTFKTGHACTFDTGSYCTFKTGSGCTFKTGHDCTFKTWSDCTFKTGAYCVILRYDTDEIITDCNDIQLAQYKIQGYVKDGIYSETGKPAIIADGILSEIISKRESKTGTIYKVINDGEEQQSYLIEVDGIYSHGATLKEAKKSLMYKIADRDTSKYDDYTLDTVLTTAEAIQLYRTITGACESGTRYFVENLEEVPKKVTIKELIAITQEQYNHDLLVEFFKKEKQ